jgi:hypothetical protein
MTAHIKHAREKAPRSTIRGFIAESLKGLYLAQPAGERAELLELKYSFRTKSIGGEVPIPVMVQCMAMLLGDPVEVMRAMSVHSLFRVAVLCA